MIFKHVDHFAEFGKIDLLIVDEGHKAKNINTKIRQGIKNLYVRKHKIILTGTPVQNNLLEFYSLMDIIEDNILGTMAEFNDNYRSKIENGLKKRALYKNMVRAQELIKELKSIYQPHFMRRTKKEIFEVKSAELSDKPLEACQLPLKTDLVIWIPLNEI
jgi:SNF2 family DNA or RNA helicase